MDTVRLLHTQAIVIGALLTVRPHGPCALRQSELAITLTQTEDTLRGEPKVNLHVLVHEVAGLADGRDENLIRVSAANLEAERVCLQHELAHIKALRWVSGGL